MICAALFTSWTPASWITIWSLPCLRISGSDTPSLSIRLRMIETERSMQAESQVLPGGGTAFNTTSRPPWRSRQGDLLVRRRARDREQGDASQSRQDQADEDQMRAPIAHSS